MPKPVEAGFDHPSDIDIAAVFASSKLKSNSKPTSGLSLPPAVPPALINIQLEDMSQGDPLHQIQIAIPPKRFKTWQRFGQEVLSYPLSGVFLMTGILSTIVSPYYTELASPYSEVYKMSIPGFIYGWRQALQALAYNKNPLSKLREIGGGNLAVGLCRKTSSVLVASGVMGLVGYGLGTFMIHYSPYLENIKESLAPLIGTGWAEGNPTSVLFLGTIGYIGIRLGDSGQMKVWEQFVRSKVNYVEQADTLSQTFLQYLLRFADTVSLTQTFLYLLPQKLASNMHWQNGLLVISDAVLRLSNYQCYRENPYESIRIRLLEDEDSASQVNSGVLNEQSKRGIQIWSLIEGAEVFMVYVLSEITCTYLDKDKCMEETVLERMTRTVGIYGGILLCEFAICNAKKLLSLSFPSVSKLYSGLCKFGKKSHEESLSINDPNVRPKSYSDLY